MHISRIAYATEKCLLTIKDDFLERETSGTRLRVGLECLKQS
jgi:hypothetical protein